MLAWLPSNAISRKMDYTRTEQGVPLTTSGNRFQRKIHNFVTKGMAVSNFGATP